MIIAGRQDGRRFNSLKSSFEYEHVAARTRRRNRIPPPLSLDVVNRDNLVRIFRKIKTGKAPGIDGLRVEDCSVSEFGAIADQVGELIRNGTWRPRPARIVKLPKPKGGEREIAIRCLVDKIVSGAVSESVTCALEKILLPSSFAFRPRRSVQAMLAVITYLIECEGRFVVAHADIRDAFGNVRIADVIQDFRRYIGYEDPDRRRFVDLIETILTGFSRSQVGIEQGDPLSPPTLNLRLHHCLDLPSTRTMDPGNPVRLRYADDIVYLCRTVSEGRNAIELDDSLLAESGFGLKRQGIYPVDLRRRDSSTEILGHRVALANGQVELRIPKGRYHDLRSDLTLCHDLPDPVESARLIVQGWITAYGAALWRCDRQQVLDRLVEVLKTCSFHELGQRDILWHHMATGAKNYGSLRPRVIDAYLRDFQLLRAPHR